MNYSFALKIAGPSLLSMVGVAGAIMPNTLLLDNFTEMTQSFRNGFAVPVSTNAHHLLLEVKANLASDETLQREHGVTTETLNSIKPYTVFGFDMFRLGMMKTEFGARIGIPEYFKHAGQEFSTRGILVNNASVPWSTPDGQKLRKSFIISEEAKKFAIARELLSLHQYENEKNAFIAAVNLCMPVFMIQGLTERLKLKSRPMLLRVVIYGMVITFVGATWVMMKDSLVVEMERKVDNALSSLSDSYRRGGLEYYSSLQQRNLALRSLLGEYGPKVYTTLGNDKALIRMKRVPIVERVEFFKKEVAKCKEANTSQET